MTTYTRSNAWNNGGTFNNPDLLWYAKGVGVMQSQTLDNQNSWWFFAAIHGQNLAGTVFPSWGAIPAPPNVPTTPLPSQADIKLYWDQCQHQSWYFAPWHRGYLIALEAQIRSAVVSLGGPDTWALPYWNYFGPGTEYEIPPAFTAQSLPDGTPNPLFVNARYGPNNDGNIFIPIPPVAQTCEKNTVYTGSNAATKPPGFGGPKTGFMHSGNVSGNLESNPHNQVHGDVGGFINQQKYGLMSDPDIAALDPIFYLHHCNIDRMWAAWNNLGNSNPTDPNWLNGPAALGGQEFAMPMPDGSSWVYTPAMVNSLSQVNYTYDNLSAGVPIQPFSALTQRLAKLGAQPQTAKITAEVAMDAEVNAELVGANDGPLQIKSSGARADVKLDSDIQGKVFESLAASAEPASAEAIAAEPALPDQVYLQLENVRGTLDAFKLNVSVNQKNAGTVSLFGLRRATLKDGDHGGGGLTFIFDITNIIDDLFLDKTVDLNTLDVRIVPNQAVPEDAELTVGRVSVYRQGQQ
jgi:tyrosinase